jgi:hypothetical protein
MSLILRNPTAFLVLIPTLLFAGMMVMLEVGRRAGLRRLAADPEGRAGLGAVEGSVLGLLGLLIAFTFSGAAERYEARRDLILQEALAVGDAWARLEMLPPEAQPPLRDGLRRYVDSRLLAYRLLPDLDAAMKELGRSEEIQQEIWSAAVAACKTAEGQRATMLLLPALDELFDMTTIRTGAGFRHPPPVIFVLLYVLGLCASGLAGYEMTGGKRRSWGHMIGFAAVTAIAVYVILDLEYPRVGLIRVDAADQLLVEAREAME